MRYGIYNSYWEHDWGTDALPYVHKVKELGFDVLEVACHDLFNSTDEYVLSLKAEAEKCGIRLTGGYGPDKAHDISSKDPEIVKAAMSKFEGIFKKMQLAGIDKLGGGLYSYWPADYTVPMDKPADLKRAIANTKDLADMAANYGVTCLGMEVLNRFEGYMLNTCEEALDFVTAVGKPNVKIMLDTFHMNIEEDSFTEAIKLAGDKLGHLHLGEANRRPPYAEGRMPWKEIGEALHSVGYDGDVVMEPFVKKGGNIGLDIRVWRDLKEGDHSVLDEDVRKSVAFLRGLWG